MSLPKPTFTLTIPSVHDGIPLDCRLFAPKPTKTELPLQAAIIAHPYAPLGGCYDDPVVNEVAGVLFKAGYFVLLFNFRGAYKSASRTSWSGKSELADYVSIYGFIVHFLNSVKTCVDSINAGESPRIDSAVGTSLTLGGYSYGSMMAMNLPSVHNVMAMFRTALDTSPEAAIRSRALDMAKEWTRELQRKIESRGQSRQSLSTTTNNNGNSLAVSMGGGETESKSRRTSRDSRRSLDLEGLRKSMDKVRSKISPGRTARSSDEEEDGSEKYLNGGTDFLSPPAISYLLISPLVGPVAGLLTCFSKLSLPTPKSSSTEKTTGNENGSQLAQHNTLAIYGEGDHFTSRRKFDRWAQSLADVPNSRFRAHRIPRGGHFWQNVEAMRELSDTVRAWAGAGNLSEGSSMTG
ncbi:MAG: hypothetical protein Q9227_000829 [Pyrenula ochraceoflavens]